MGIVMTVLLLSLSFLSWSGSGKVIKVYKNEKSFVITLAANPTTGYEWSVLEYDKVLLTLSHSEYKKPDTQLIGAGGTMDFTFTQNEGTVYPDKTKMLFRYARPWESNAGTTQKVLVRFVATKLD